MDIEGHFPPREQYKQKQEVINILVYTKVNIVQYGRSTVFEGRSETMLMDMVNSKTWELAKDKITKNEEVNSPT